jgi:MoxR-like ATPase
MADASPDAPPPNAPTGAATTTTDDLGGSYEVIRRRLLTTAEALAQKAEQLNAKRKEVFGGSELALVATERVRTENNCLPRDIVAMGSRLLVGFNVFVGMKSEVTVPDVFALFHLDRPEGGALTLEPLPIEDGGFFSDERFQKDFTDLFRYVRDARLGQLRRNDQRLLAVFTTGTGERDKRVLRWGIDAGGKVSYIDARGEDDHVHPRAHDFAWKVTTRDDQVHGRHPHVSILDEVFVETIGGDLTIKVENNTSSGQGLYSEPVEDANQALDDAQIAYARLGALILIRVKPYRETASRYFIFNPRRKQVLRVDSIEQACLALPEDQGVLYPDGYYLLTGESKRFESDGGPMRFERVVKAPNGEDVLYVFYRDADGSYLLFPYNLIRKEVATPIACHGYSLFEDGTLIVVRAAPGDEATRVHPMQVWRTPFTSAEFAAAAPTTGSFLAKVGNPDLVRGISESLSLKRLASTATPNRQTWEDLIGASGRMVDAFHWLGHPECFDLLSTLKELRGIAEQIIDEFEKVEAIRRRAVDALAKAEEHQKELLSSRPEDIKSAAEFMAALTALRRQRGSLGTLRELRYMDLPRVDALEAQVDARFKETSFAAAGFLSGGDSLKPLLDAIATAVDRAGKAARTVELAPVSKEVDTVHEGLTVLSETVAGLEVDDPTMRTRILDAVSEVFAQLNRARAIVQARAKELRGSEGRAEFGVQVKVFQQAVQSALAVADSPEKCDASLSRLLVQVEELEGRFGEFDEFAAELATKREELHDAFSARRQTLLDERQKRAQNLLNAADRILQGVLRRARAFTSPEELNAFFAGDPMVAKARDLVEQLRGLNDTVKADEVDGRIRSAKQDGLRALRDRSDLFEGADNVIKLGRHRFFVNTQPLELTIVPREGALAVHLTGTDYFEPIEDPILNEARDLWEQALPSESPDVYRGEYLAYTVLSEALRGERGSSLDRLKQEALTEGALLATVRAAAADRHDEGYERGVHDVDAAAILAKLVALLGAAGTLRHESGARALGVLHLSTLDDTTRALLTRRCRSAARLRALTGAAEAQDEITHELTAAIAATSAHWRLPASEGERRRAGRYLVDELGGGRTKCVLSGEAVALRDAFLAAAHEAGARLPFEDDVRAMEKFPAEVLALALRWVEGFAARTPGGPAFAREVAVALVTGKRVEREASSAHLEASVEGLLGQHPRVRERTLALRLDEFLARLEGYVEDRLPRWRAYRKARTEVAARERHRLRLDEFAPRVLSSFVRNQLIDEVYLPLVGANLAKQLGAAGDAKRTDLMGLLLLVSPPGYGKTTLMEYVASKLGLVFVKVNGPSLGHGVVSLDPVEAPNATSRQEVDKINLALEMGNNVMLYLDDIQHTNPELLQKFISLCDGSRRVEGVWKGRTRTYDLRGKRFCVVMAGNPYTESGERFRIPDMLANRADTYNLGDILGGRDDAFARSYLENALTSNATLAPLAGRDPKDLDKLIRMSGGEAIPSTELAHPYSAAEVAEVTAVLRNLTLAQRVLLAVNAEYIRSASQEDSYRTEPAFKLQGSYRNMNKIAEKVVSAHTADEVQGLIDDHYASESQTLTTGAEQNLLKLAELRGRVSEAQRTRWEAIKKEFARQKRVGGKDDDPVARVTGTLSTLGEELERMRAEITRASDRSVDEQSNAVRALGPQLAGLEAAMRAVARPTLEVKVPGPEATASAIVDRLSGLGQTLGPLMRATQHGLGTLPDVLTTIVAVLERLEKKLAEGGLAVSVAGVVAAEPGAAPMAVGAAPMAHAAPMTHPAPMAHGGGAGPVVRRSSVPPPPRRVEVPSAPYEMPPLAGAEASVTARVRFESELGAVSVSNFFIPAGADRDVVRDGGIFVQTYRKLPQVGSVVTVALRFAGGGIVETEAEVVYAVEASLSEPHPGFGARLLHLTPAQEGILRRYLLDRDPLVRKG